jgi:hypothetical protein
MPQFRSPLESTDLAVTPARLGVARLGLTRLGFTPTDADPLTMPDSGDDDYYAHREVRLEANVHTEVLTGVK